MDWKKLINIFIIIASFLLTISCSTKYMSPRLDDFADATDLIGKNIIYTYEQLQAEEINILIEDLTKLDSIKPDDFLPKVLTFEKMQIRKELIDNIINYTNLLKSIFDKDYKNSIIKNTEIFNKNIDSISINHKGFLTKKEQGILTGIIQAVPEILTYTKRKNYTLNIMKEMQPLIEKIAKKLKEETESVRLLIDTYYLKQFMRVADKWPEKESKRLKYSKIGVKLAKKRYKIKVILDDLINAIDYIPKTHKGLRNALKNNNNPVYGLKELINFAYRINETYKEFAEVEN